VNADVPGFAKDDLKVSVADGVLTLSGERKEEKREEDPNHQYLRMERHAGRVTRSIRLPDDCDPQRVRAKHEHGVLKLELPRSPARSSQAQQILIN